MDYKILGKNDKIFSGDYLKYYDEYDECKGCGVYVKKVIDSYKPLTNSYYLLKNMNTGKYWKVKCCRYTFMYKPHKTKALDLTELEIIKEIKKKYLD